MLKKFLEQARRDEPVYITDVRRAFQAAGTRPFHLRLLMYDGSVRMFPLLLPRWEGAEEEAFVRSYLHGTVYNILSALGGRRMEIFLDSADRELAGLAAALDGVFQTELPKHARTGYGKCLNVNERILASLGTPETAFSFAVRDISEEAAPEREKAPASRPDFPALLRVASSRTLLGLDVGGTDIKLCAAVDGALAFCKEYDWDPAAYPSAEQIVEPILLLARLGRAAAALYTAGRGDDLAPFAQRETSPAALERAVAALEAAAGAELRGFDAIGLSFPDVIIQNRIAGGETPKTAGMRAVCGDYEAEFAKLTRLDEALGAYTVPGGAVRCANDGNIAAFTAAVELSAAGEALSGGFFAHTLGTDLGTGQVLSDASVPDLPMELYNLVIDLGSFGRRAFPAGDARSIRGGAGLAGTAGNYTGQAAAFRLAAQEPELRRELLERGLLTWEGDTLRVPTHPADRRKACLEFLMEKAAGPDGPACRAIFREIGAALAVVWAETELLLEPETRERTLFGRLVKEPRCFAEIQAGARLREPEIVLRRADEALANSALMRQLAACPGRSVAQFAQAVGAMYYACTNSPHG